jgi:hypothetical protein
VEEKTQKTGVQKVHNDNKKTEYCRRVQGFRKLMQRFLITFQGLELEALFVAGDANQDGVLTFSEFREILRTADSTVSHQIALRMFRETLCFMPDGGDSISPFAFATVAHAHGIKAPPAVVFNLLKKTWLQVSSIVHIPTSLLHNVPSFNVIYTAPTTFVWHKIIHKRSSLKEKHKDYW